MQAQTGWLDAVMDWYTCCKCMFSNVLRHLVGGRNYSESEVNRMGKYHVGPVGLLLLGVVIAGPALLMIWRPGGDDGLALRERVAVTSTVRIGYANEAPYGYLDSDSGRITGEAPEIARAVLERMGVEHIEPVVTEFGSLIPGLKAGRFDMIAAGMYITAERAEEIDFSDPTYAIGMALLVSRGNPLDLHSFADVAGHASARIGVMGGGVEHGYALAEGVPEGRIVVFPDYPSALEGLKAGRIDAVAATMLTAHDLLRKADDPGIERARPFTDPVIDGQTVRGYGAFGFRKQDDPFRREFNRHLNAFIGTPEHLKLVRPFGFSEETLPGDVTAEHVARQSHQ